MHLLTISGFLGSGKTTLIIKLAKAATQKGLRAAILVNEVGEIGIDDQLLRQLLPEYVERFGRPVVVGLQWQKGVV